MNTQNSCQERYMEVKFEEMDKHEPVTDFLNDEKVVSIIRYIFDKRVPDKYNEWKLFSNHKLLIDIVGALYDIIND